MPNGAVSVWSTTDKVSEAILRSRRYMPESIARQLDAFLTPGNLALMAGTLAVWAGSHFFGVGEVVDVALLLVGAFTIGWSVSGVVRGGTTDQDLDRAARLFASAVVTAGLTAMFAILLRRSASSLQATRGSTVREVLAIRRPGMVPVESEPPGTGLFRTPTVTGRPTMAAGRGATTALGDVEYSTAGRPRTSNLSGYTSWSIPFCRHDCPSSAPSGRVSRCRLTAARPSCAT